MDIKKILSICDHTLLAQTATEEEIKALLDDGIKYSVASVCIPPRFVKFAAQYAKCLPICTVIGFPNGYNTTEVKAYEAQNAVANGADEIDMVIDLGWVKEHRYDKVLNEINAVKEACEGKLLKVIIETCLLTDGEKVELCGVVSQSQADYIKTSTGFSTKGATFDDIALMRKYCKPELKIKAAGGISSIADAEKFIELGADRLGTSRIVKLVKAGNLLA
ncbi:MAG: deoxyribose-phosphate aldolase [Clostridia bacterium]|nr:deoxyribose-phosphate aldolase [Clostridia bacterium]